MRRVTALVMMMAAFGGLPGSLSAWVVDHRCTDLAQVPDAALQMARTELKVSFAHGAAAAQITAGLAALKTANPSLYSFSLTPGESESDTLSIWNRMPTGELGEPEKNNPWFVRTEKFLTGAGRDRNVVIWAWNDQLGTISAADFQSYFKQMDVLEKRFPKVHFIYMTGPLDGTGEDGELYRRNEAIRKFCRENHKNLFDFADLESFAPGGNVDYRKYRVKSDGSYLARGKKRNWAQEWLSRHPEFRAELPAKVPQSTPLHAALKARAFWWMMGCLAGWVPLSHDNPGGLRPIPRTPAVASAATKSSAGNDAQKHLYRFDDVQDYRNWILSGAQGTLIPEQGTGMTIPPGTPGVAIHRGRMPVCALEFKARLETGTTLSWYFNTEWNNSWNPTSGLGGVCNDQGCLLLLNGKSFKFKKSVAGDRKEHRFQIWLRDGQVFWAIDGKLVASHSLPAELANRAGVLAIGGWESTVHVDSVFFQTR